MLTMNAKVLYAWNVVRENVLESWEIEAKLAAVVDEVNWRRKVLLTQHNQVTKINLSNSHFDRKLSDLLVYFLQIDKFSNYIFLTFRSMWTWLTCHVDARVSFKLLLKIRGNKMLVRVQRNNVQIEFDTRRRQETFRLQLTILHVKRL